MTPELLAALKVLLSESPEDWVYEVRSQVTGEDDYDWASYPNSWDHPRVKAYAEAIEVIQREVELAEKRVAEL